MRLVEQHRISRADPRFAAIDQAAFASKNLYNQALYVTRQAFIHQQRVIAYPELARALKTTDPYRALPRKVAQWVLKQVALAWTSYCAACAAYTADPVRFLGHPRLPRYLDKQHGRNLLVYTTQALSQPSLRAGRIEPSGLDIQVPTKQTRVAQVRIVPRAGFYVVEVVYERAPVPAPVNPALVASVDVGADVLAAITSNQQGFVPRLVNGRPIKSRNQFYNKQRAQLQAALGHPATTGTTKRMERLTTRRTDRIQHYLHTASRRIIDLLVTEGIGTLVIGQNPFWKQHARLGRVTNQHFVQLPHTRFIQLLTYKAALVGIRVIVTEESYTSKASFLDGDPLPVYGDANIPAFSGRRIQADVNGSYNIGRKAFPEAFPDSLLPLWAGDRGRGSSANMACRVNRSIVR